MNILTLIKRVPDTEQDDLRIIGEGKEVDLSDLPFKLNDWDNYVVEEAARIVEKSGGTMTAISIGDAESDEVLRRADERRKPLAGREGRGGVGPGRRGQ